MRVFESGLHLKVAFRQKKAEEFLIIWDNHKLTRDHSWKHANPKWLKLHVTKGFSCEKIEHVCSITKEEGRKKKIYLTNC